MAISKVVYGNKTLIDLTADTITADKLLVGTTAHGSDGELVVGTCDYDMNTQETTATDAEVLLGKKYARKGVMGTGSMPNIGGVKLEIGSKDAAVSIVKGYHDGSGTAIISDIEKAKIIPSNIRAGVTILGVSGDMSGTEGAKPQAKNVTPTTSVQEILPDEGYNYLSQVTVAAIPYSESDNSAGGKTVTIG